MAERTNPLVSALDGIAPGRHGRATGAAGVAVSEVAGAGLAVLTARRGHRAALLERARTSLGLELPAGPRRVADGALACIGLGPDQWLVCLRPAPAQGMEALLSGPISGLAAVVDLSHARTLLRISGPRARAALAKGLPIDLHPRAFRPGDAAATAAAHVPVQLWQVDEAPTYDLAVPRTLALSFWHWLEASAAEFGLVFTPAGPP